MQAVGRLGSYISKSVYTVSGPFHPFGGAVDIIVVEQQDGTFKSSPWYVKFGKFQGVLKAKEKIVNISVNGIEADFHMYLDHKGEAHFLRDVDVDMEGEGECLLSPLSSGEDTDGQSNSRRTMKSRSCNYDASEASAVARVDTMNGSVVARTNSRRSRILRYVFGGRPVKEDQFTEEGNETGVIRTESLERAEIAADLLEVNWSTNLASTRHKKDNVSQLSSHDMFEGDSGKDLQIDDDRSNDEAILCTSMQGNADSLLLLDEANAADYDTCHNPHSSLHEHVGSMEQSGIDPSSLASDSHVGTCTLVGDGAEDVNNEVVLERSREIAGNSQNSENVVSGVVCLDLQVLESSAEGEACNINKLKAHIFDENHDVTSESGLTKDEHRDRLRSSLYCEMPESSCEGVHSSNVQIQRTPDVSCAGFAENCVRSQSLHTTSELITEIFSVPDRHMIVTEEQSRLQDMAYLRDEYIRESEGKSSDLKANDVITQTYSETVTIRPIDGSVEEFESRSMFTISTFINSNSPVVDGRVIEGEDNLSTCPTMIEPLGDRPDSVTVFPDLPPSESLEEQQLLFGSIDDIKLSKFESVSSGCKENDPITSSQCTDGAIEPLSPDYKSDSSSDKPIQKNPETGMLNLMSESIDIPRSSEVLQLEEPSRMVKSLPNMWSQGNVHAYNPGNSLHHSLEADSALPNLRLLRKAVTIGSVADIGDEKQLTDDDKGMKEPKGGPDMRERDPSGPNDAPGGNWTVWPFKRSGSLKLSEATANRHEHLDDENNSNSTNVPDEKKEIPKLKVTKRKVRAITPTSEQLASLNLKEGKNTITFTFSTAMLGKQQVDARIYLWRWDTRVVISDVDGTITRSDILGQFMPLVGVDWSQTGVAHLFSAIKENGYQLLFLSARAISQAYHTRQFLFNLKQDGKALPDGPVVISPDGLFPSLFREVVRRAPHEFKIACLENIKALFPSDRNPFYAGFGNRDTDEISYLKVGIPKGKIFIINPKGEVVVNRRLDRKSYTSLHALVNGMFPPMSSSEQEDFNSWNFWKLPPPTFD